MLEEFTLEVCHSPESESREIISRGLHAYNVQHWGEYRWEPLDVYARQSNGSVVGGLLGEYLFGWLVVHTLWVAEQYRGQKLGTQILEAAERSAVQHGCHSARLDTLSFQARGFYERQGYTVFGKIEFAAPEIEQFFLYKRLQSQS